MSGSHHLDPDGSIQTWSRAYPKVDLHLHLEGAIPVETIWMLAERNGQDLPVSSVDELSRFCYCESFDKLREVYDLVIRCLKSKEDFTESVIALGQKLRDDNVVYSEITCTPYFHVLGGMKFGDFLDGMEAGRKQLENQGGPRIAWIFDFPRHIPQSGEITLEFAIAAKETGVIGFGMGGREMGYPARLFTDLFDRSRSEGFHSVPHAGETVGPESVFEAIELLGAERIGHGITSVNDPELLKLLIQHRIPLEICLSSNVCLGNVESLKEHPIRELWDKGVFCTINTDDPTLFKTTLSHEYTLLKDNLGFSIHDAIQFITNGADAVFPENWQWVKAKIDIETPKFLS